MAVTKELLQMDLYALLGIEQTATDKEVKKAYRQKALSYHPDKNPDNPRAAELFPQLSRALEVLTDATARATYDKVRKARKQARVRLELEARERQAQAQRSKDAEGSRNPRTLEQEIHEPRSRHCTPAWVTRVRLRLEKKQKRKYLGWLQWFMPVLPAFSAAKMRGSLEPRS
uniref:DnaJ homolog subfamily C member 17 n=1 Tax=Papio anubis TaxID=9555 RepID=A0A2I3M576_PAPAN